MANRRKLIAIKILKNVVFSEPSAKVEGACWIWQGSHSGSGRGGGYPRMNLDGATVAVHRVSWINVNGAVPPGKQIDHICRNRLCVNPNHLEMVTHKENQRRRDEAKKKELERQAIEMTQERAERDGY